MSRTKEILISLLAIIVLILAITTNVFATSADDLLNALGNNQNNNTVTQIPSKDNNNTNNNTNNNNNKLNNVVNNKANVSNATEHADAAIYAYKKIREYNV